MTDNALLQVVQLEGLDRPNKNALECLQLLLFRYSIQGNARKFNFLAGSEYPTWSGSEGLDDFLVIQAPKAQRDVFQERMTSIIRTLLNPIMSIWDSVMSPGEDEKYVETLEKLREKDRKNSSSKAPERKPEGNPDTRKKDKAASSTATDPRRIHHMAKILGNASAVAIAVFAALCPILSILVLFFIRQTLNRIYALMGLTILFALTVKWGTSAKSMEVFAVTAA
jgi:hypothetical protein